MTEIADERVQTGRGCDIAETAVVGTPAGDRPGTTEIGADATIRAGTVVYTGVSIGDRFTTGHNAVIREGVVAGDDLLVGTNAVLDGDLELGTNVRLQTGAYLPPETVAGDDIFIGPHAVVTNDRYPVREASELSGVTLESDVTLGANATVLPGLTVGENSFVAAGALVTEDVPPDSLAVGAPAEYRPLPPALEGGNEFP